MLFGVPDEIMDMTRNSGMVERQIFMYWKVVFGHWDGFEWFGYFTEVPRGYRNPPGEFMGLHGP